MITTRGCTVAGGKCTIKETIASGFPAGAGSEMQVLGCGLKGSDPNANFTFSCAIMVK